MENNLPGTPKIVARIDAWMDETGKVNCNLVHENGMGNLTFLNTFVQVQLHRIVGGAITPPPMQVTPNARGTDLKQ